MYALAEMEQLQTQIERADVIVLVGFQGTGKTTLRRAIEQVVPDLFVAAFDDLRARRSDGVLDQETTGDIANTLIRQAREARKAGRKVLVDNMNLSSKSRAAWLQLPGRRLAVICYASPALAEERVLLRAANGGHRVPVKAVRQCVRRLELPMLDPEGRQADSVHEVAWAAPDAIAGGPYPELFQRDPLAAFGNMLVDPDLGSYAPEIAACVGFLQHNEHHRLQGEDETVDAHLLAAGDAVADSGADLDLVRAALLHDIGKPLTQERMAAVLTATEILAEGEKVKVLPPEEAVERLGAAGVAGMVPVEQMPWRGVFAGWIPSDAIAIDPNMHYYDHENVGAPIALQLLLRLGLSLSRAYRIALLIQWHMSLPYKADEWTEKAVLRWLQKVGPLAPDLLALRRADKLGSGQARDSVEAYIQALEMRIRAFS